MCGGKIKEKIVPEFENWREFMDKKLKNIIKERRYG